jgi:TolB-like protein/tetratricopeptide (TPR) repeat protein
MKRCPDCLRDYYDQTLLYCLDDGNALVEGPAPTWELTTVIMSEPASGEGSPPLFADDLSETASAVAVLPFANLSRDENSEYFSDGLAEELLSVLSRIKGLRVVARTSAFFFKGKQVGVEEIGRSLRVGSVLEGSVRMAGNRVRITVRLVDVERGYNLWSETYDRTMEDIFTIQDDIARSVVEQIRTKLLGEKLGSEYSEEIAEEIGRAVKGRAADVEAHRLMMVGRHLLERGNRADVKTAMEYFRRALEIDPNYALCWAELGRAHQVESGQLWNSFDDGYDQAEILSKKALELEPDLAEGHAVLGYVYQMRGFDFVEAERCFKRALELAPKNSYVLRRMGILVRDLGRFDEALHYFSRAVGIDPLSPSNWWQTGFAHFFADELTKAESAFRRALELGPQAVFVHAFLALVLLRQGRVEQALIEAHLEPDGKYWRPWALAIIHHAAGRDGESKVELSKLDPDQTPFQIAEVHSMRGETDDAFEWLERTIDRCDPARIHTRESPFLRPLHSDPRWGQLLKRIGFPDRGTTLQMNDTQHAIGTIMTLRPTHSPKNKHYHR